MTTFKRSDHIYKLFWAERAIEIIYGIKFVEDPEKCNFSSNMIYKRTFPIVFGYLLLCCYNIYYLINKDSLKLFEFFGIPLSVILIIVDIMLWCDGAKIKETVSRVIDLLQIVDEIVANFQNQLIKPTRHLLIDLLILLTLTSILIMTPIFTLLFWLPSYTRTFMFIQISVGFYYTFCFYLMIIRLLVIDRLKMLNMMIRFRGFKFGSKTFCQWCDKKETHTEYQICEKHRIM